MKSIADVSDRTYILAGNSTFTVHNPKTGNRFTFKITKARNRTGCWWVKVLYGQDNESDFMYIGTIIKARYIHNSRCSCVSPDAMSNKCFQWFWKHVDDYAEHGVELVKSTNCARCGRKLTVPISVHSGFGPECIKKV